MFVKQLQFQKELTVLIIIIIKHILLQVMEQVKISYWFVEFGEMEIVGVVKDIKLDTNGNFTRDYAEYGDTFTHINITGDYNDVQHKEQIQFLWS